jgi:hypothetical protein
MNSLLLGHIASSCFATSFLPTARGKDKENPRGVWDALYLCFPLKGLGHEMIIFWKACKLKSVPFVYAKIVFLACTLFKSQNNVKFLPAYLKILTNLKIVL